MPTFQILSALSLAAFPQMINADWYIWSGDCATGLTPTFGDGFGSGSANTAAQGACDGGFSSYSDGDFTGANPCAVGSEVFEYRRNGDGWDVSVEGGDGSQVGRCQLTTFRDMESCNGPHYSCIYTRELDCFSSYCG